MKFYFNTQNNKDGEKKPLPNNPPVIQEKPIKEPEPRREKLGYPKKPNIGK